MDEKKEEKKKTTRKSTKSETVKKAAPKKTATKKAAAKKTVESAVKEEPKKTVTKKAPVKKATKKSELVSEAIIDEKVIVENKPLKEEKQNFCTKCGKKLEAGEVCDCEVKKNSTFVDKDAIVNKSKNIFDIILGVYKKPYEFSREYTKNGDYKNSFILIAIIAVSLGLLITALTYAAFHINFLGNQFDSLDYNIPYFKVFIIWTIVSFIMSFIPIFITFIANNMFSDSKFDFDNSLNLYASTLSSVILVNLVSAVFIFAGLFVKFFLLISFLAAVFAFINYIFVYRDIVLFEKDKESYIFLGIALVWIIGFVLICSIFASGVNGLDIYDTITTTLNK